MEDTGRRRCRTGARWGAGSSVRRATSSASIAVAARSSSWPGPGRPARCGRGWPMQFGRGPHPGRVAPRRVPARPELDRGAARTRRGRSAHSASASVRSSGPRGHQPGPRRSRRCCWRVRWASAQVSARGTTMAWQRSDQLDRLGQVGLDQQVEQVLVQRPDLDVAAGQTSGSRARLSSWTRSWAWSRARWVASTSPGPRWRRRPRRGLRRSRSNTASRSFWGDETDMPSDW